MSEFNIVNQLINDKARYRAARAAKNGEYKLLWNLEISLYQSLNQTMVLYLNKYIHPFINHYDLLYAN